MQEKHQSIMDYLLDVKSSTGVTFSFRKTNRFGRLDSGYWFIGNDDYLQLSFWDGYDHDRRINNIGFVVLDDGLSYIELSARGEDKKIDLLSKIANRIGGFEREEKYLWRKYFSGSDYLGSLRRFIEIDKPVIDSYVKRNIGSGVGFFDDRHEEKLKKLVTERIVNRRMARICWNENGWSSPSGRAGKSKNKKSYENKLGFGHEEWLLDANKVIDGYHYGYLQAVTHAWDSYVGKSMDVFLYTKNGDSGEVFWVGRINNVEVISKKESERIREIYEEEGWLEKMEGQLASAGINLPESPFSNDPVVNFRYKPSDLLILDEPVLCREGDVSAYYYSSMPFLYEVPSAFGGGKGLSKTSDRHAVEEFKFSKGHNPKIKGKKGRVRSSEYEIIFAHNALQDELYEKLAKIHGKSRVGTENRIGAIGAIDLVVKESDGLVFFELKTGLSAKQNIREAIGQLLEYSSWPGECRAKRWVIVSPAPVSKDVKKYMDFIRKKYRLPVFYLSFNLGDESVGELV